MRLATWRWFALLIPALAGCGSGPQWTEVARAPAPGGELDAVVSESSGGATTDYVYRVDVLASGESPDDDAAVARLVGAIRNQQAWGVNLRWADRNTLEVRYLRAKRTELVDHPTHDIDVRLIAGVNDPDAPAGGMAWSRRAVAE